MKDSLVVETLNDPPSRGYHAQKLTWKLKMMGLFSGSMIIFGGVYFEAFGWHVLLHFN